MLNEFLLVSHSSTGTLSSSAVTNALPSPIPTSNLGNGTASSSNFLRGDGTWAVPSGGVTLDSTASDIQPNTTTGSPVAGSSGKAADAGHQHALVAHNHTTTNLGGQIPVGGLSAAGTAGTTTFLRGDGSWSTPASASNATTTTPGLVQLAGDFSNTSTATDPIVSTSNGLPIVTTTGTQTLTNKSISGSQITSAVANATNATTAASVTTIPALTGDVTSSGSSNATTLTSSSNVESIISANTTVAGALQKSNNLSDLVSPNAARTNLGLGTAATENVGTSSGTVMAGNQAAGGDLSGTLPNPTVAKVNGVNLPTSAPTGSGFVLTTTSASATAWGTVGGTTDWINVKTYGATGNGTTDDTTTIQNALNAAASGQVVFLPAGTYKVSAPLILNPGNVIMGESPLERGQLNGSTLKPSSSFVPGSSYTASGVIELIGGNSYFSDSNFTILNLLISGTNISSMSGVSGVYAYGGVAVVTIENCTFASLPQDGIHLGDSAPSPGYGRVDGVNLNNCQVQNCAGYGYYIAAPDSTVINCKAIGCTNDGFFIGASGNSRLIGCTSQQCTNGYHVSTNSTGMSLSLTACSTQINTNNGLLIDTTGGNGIITVANCMFVLDGTGGTYAGINLNATSMTVNIRGGAVYTAGTTGTQYPAYGLSVMGCTSPVTVGGIVLAGYTTPYNNGGSNTYVPLIGSDTVFITGNLNAPAAVTQKAQPISYQPSNPTGTTSMTEVMMGLGGTCKYTPGNSGKVLVTATMLGFTDTALVPFTIGGRYGTGTAPTNSAAVNGTLFGAASDITTRGTGTGVGVGITLTQVVSLTPGTAYWFDIALATSASADEAQVTNIMMTVAEQ